MPTELSIHAVHQGGMRFLASAGDRSVNMDYPLRPGETSAGFRPLELLLASLAGCAGSTMALLLSRMKQPVQGVEVNARGKRCDEHPTVFTEITLEFIIHGSGVESAAVERSLAQARDQLCPVWAMLKSGTQITSSFRVIEG